MKTKLICTGLLALAASFGAAAEESLTGGCMSELAFEPRLALIADKVGVAHSAETVRLRAPERAVSPEERAAVALWAHLRNECFEFGAAQRRASLPRLESALVKSVFVFQQRLVAELQGGRVTYAEFNRRRLELVEAAGQEI